MTTAHDLPAPGSSPNAGAEPAEVAPSADRGRFWPLAKIAVFDIAGPLVAYSLLRSAGLSAVSALVLSGIFPAVGLALGMARDRRVDVVGVLVLLGIVVGSGLGLASGNARLVLLEGSCRRRSSHRLEHRVRPESKAHRRGPRRRGPSPRRGPASHAVLADSGLRIPAAVGVRCSQ